MNPIIKLIDYKFSCHINWQLNLHWFSAEFVQQSYHIPLQMCLNLWKKLPRFYIELYPSLIVSNEIIAKTTYCNFQHILYKSYFPLHSCSESFVFWKVTLRMEGLKWYTNRLLHIFNGIMAVLIALKGFLCSWHFAYYILK